MNIISSIANWVTKITNDLSSKDNEYKILVLGEEGVGKSSFCNRYVNNTFKLDIKPSLSNSNNYFHNFKFFGDNLEINLIDTSSTILSNEHSNLYCNVKGAFVLYDITNHNTFDKVDSWILDLRQILGRKIPIVLVGNKSDLNFLKEVHTEELKEKASGLGCDYKEVSCCSEENSVNDIIEFLVGKIYYLNLPEQKQKYFIEYFN